MITIGEDRNYNEGDDVFCIISVGAPLTLFGEYTITSVIGKTKWNKTLELQVMNDDDMNRSYNMNRFLPIKYKYLREQNLNELLK